MRGLYTTGDVGGKGNTMASGNCHPTKNAFLQAVQEEKGRGGAFLEGGGEGQRTVLGKGNKISYSIQAQVTHSREK